MTRLDRESAEIVFKQITDSRRKLTVRNWENDAFKESKETMIELIMLGCLTFDTSKGCIVYQLEDKIGELEKVEFVSRDTIKLRQDAINEGKTEEQKGINLVCAYAQIKLHQYVELSSSDEQYISLICHDFLF